MIQDIAIDKGLATIVGVMDGEDCQVLAHDTVDGTAYLAVRQRTARRSMGAPGTGNFGGGETHIRIFQILGPSKMAYYKGAVYKAKEILSFPARKQQGR